VRFQPTPSLDEPIREEFQRVGDILQNLDAESLALAKLQAAPGRPFDGMIVYADGTNWNPGGGEGIYAFYATVWNKL